jgi:hypothetical protein
MPVHTMSETVWVHGNAGQLQAVTGFTYERVGPFVRLKADMEGEIWLHYAIPLTVGSQPRIVTGVFSQLRSWGRGEIGMAHLWNGSAMLAQTHAATSAKVELSTANREEPFAIHDLGLSSNTPITAAIGVSLLIKAYKARDAVAVAGVGIKTSAPN